MTPTPTPPPTPSPTLPSAVTRRIERARRYGFTATGPPEPRFTAKEGSHDDGPGHGMFLGGLGTPALSRDLEGRFSRWHLAPGTHLLADVEQCRLRVRWRDRDGAHSVDLCRADVGDYRASGLAPLWHEEFDSEEMPFRVVLTSFAPVVPGDEEASALPVLCFDVWIAGAPSDVDVDVALFWPNLTGWNASRVTTVDRGDRPWPGHHHAGNRNRPGRADDGGLCVVQGREAGLRGPESTAGEVCVAVRGDAGASYSRHVQFKTDQNATGTAEHRQPHTFAAVRHAFDTSGRLDSAAPDGSWAAHWHEPVGSAVAAHHPGGRAHGRGAVRTRFVVAFDWPDVVFGQGRAWRRRYAVTGREPASSASTADEPPADAEALAAYAHEHADAWLAAADTWHRDRLDALTRAGWPDRVAGCVLNETNLLTALGTIWVAGTHHGHAPPEPRLLGGSEHFGLLEGFDTGYFYVHTSDLWHYAFPAVTRTWPRLADLAFADLRDALTAEDPARRPIYRSGEERQLLAAGRLPHDMGAVWEDPFVRLNGYAMRDDPNTWRDAGPAFVLGTFVHRRLTGREPAERDWEAARRAAETVAADASDGAVPRHDEFGDSTWDNLGLRGRSTYAAALCAGMWAVLDAESRRRGEDHGDRPRLTAAADALASLWDEDHFRACSEGKYTGALMPDSLLGLFYAEIAGAPPVVPRARVARHLATAYRTAHLGYHDGRLGPLLIAEPGAPRYARDGGEELQVNEVILGSAWMFAAMLHWYGLRDEAAHVATSLRDVLYGDTGLQYRSPAAVDADGRFRAPLNMRPLAAWWLDVVTAVRPP